MVTYLIPTNLYQHIRVGSIVLDYVFRSSCRLTGRLDKHNEESVNEV